MPIIRYAVNKAVPGAMLMFIGRHVAHGCLSELSYGIGNVCSLLECCRWAGRLLPRPRPPFASIWVMLTIFFFEIKGCAFLPPIRVRVRTRYRTDLSGQVAGR